ncbi:hypothetical protein RchiOBHm_Chr3g0493831 [Rosa chinensis]|uniref:Uncharacterized protein n=1 Tax=Rosa chinensis TaxID=74649 RepID=A0A2P6RGU9_ROSCH|nr:hypothetical protein RchiOBHm_Chr3g0493831 [Rosa chinensis]
MKRLSILWSSSFLFSFSIKFFDYGFVHLELFIFHVFLFRALDVSHSSVAFVLLVLDFGL